MTLCLFVINIMYGTGRFRGVLLRYAHWRELHLTAYDMFISVEISPIRGISHQEEILGKSSIVLEYLTAEKPRSKTNPMWGSEAI